MYLELYSVMERTLFKRLDEHIAEIGAFQKPRMKYKPQWKKRLEITLKK